MKNLRDDDPLPVPQPRKPPPDPIQLNRLHYFPPGKIKYVADGEVPHTLVWNHFRDNPETTRIELVTPKGQLLQYWLRPNPEAD